MTENSLRAVAFCGYIRLSVILHSPVSSGFTHQQALNEANACVFSSSFHYFALWSFFVVLNLSPGCDVQ